MQDLQLGTRKFMKFLGNNMFIVIYSNSYNYYIINN